MAAAADSPSNNHSPRSSGFSGGDGLNNSPQFRRNGRNNFSSPWANIVRGESEAVPAAPSSPSSLPVIATQEHNIIADSGFSPVKASSSSASTPPDNSALEIQLESSDNSNSNVARTKKPAWKKPSNVVDEVGPVTPVMGAVSWPALSESTRASPKSSSDSLKALSDGSVSVSQGPAIASSPQKQATNNANPNSTPNHAFHGRQKSMKRGGGGGGLTNGGFNQPSSPPSPAVEMPQNNSGKPGPVVLDSSPRDHHHQKNNNWENGPRGGFGSQPHIGNDHPQQRNTFRRSNSGPHPRGDGSYHNNYGGRRDHDWNHHRSFNGRDVHMQQQRMVPRNFIRQPLPNSLPFISPQHMRPFGNPMGFPDMTSPVYYVPAPPPQSIRGVPFVTHAPPPGIFFHAPDPELHNALVSQIDYYFSSDNLCSDIYLRQNMDEQGWVPISLIASFNKVKGLTNNIQFILDAVRTSTVVEVQGDKIRKRGDWMNWPLLHTNQFTTTLGPQSPGRSSYDILATRVQNVGLEEKTSNHNSLRTQADAHAEAVLSRSSSGELNSQSQMSSGERTRHTNVQVGSDPFSSGRSLNKSDLC